MGRMQGTHYVQIHEGHWKETCSLQSFAAGYHLCSWEETSTRQYRPLSATFSNCVCLCACASQLTVPADQWLTCWLGGFLSSARRGSNFKPTCVQYSACVGCHRICLAISSKVSIASDPRSTARAPPQWWARPSAPQLVVYGTSYCVAPPGKKDQATTKQFFGVALPILDWSFGKSSPFLAILGYRLSAILACV